MTTLARGSSIPPSIFFWCCSFDQLFVFRSSCVRLYTLCFSTLARTNRRSTTNLSFSMFAHTTKASAYLMTVLKLWNSRCVVMCVCIVLNEILNDAQPRSLCHFTELYCCFFNCCFLVSVFISSAKLCTLFSFFNLFLSSNVQFNDCNDTEKCNQNTNGNDLFIRLWTEQNKGNKKGNENRI